MTKQQSQTNRGLLHNSTTHKKPFCTLPHRELSARSYRYVLPHWKFRSLLCLGALGYFFILCGTLSSSLPLWWFWRSEVFSAHEKHGTELFGKLLTETTVHWISTAGNSFGTNRKLQLFRWRNLKQLNTKNQFWQLEFRDFWSEFTKTELWTKNNLCEWWKKQAPANKWPKKRKYETHSHCSRGFFLNVNCPFFSKSFWLILCPIVEAGWSHFTSGVTLEVEYIRLNAQPPHPRNRLNLRYVCV